MNKNLLNHAKAYNTLGFSQTQTTKFSVISLFKQSYYDFFNFKKGVYLRNNGNVAFYFDFHRGSQNKNPRYRCFIVIQTVNY